jgi:hypothetical protein
MHNRKDGYSQIVVPNRPVKTATGRYVTARVWVNFITPLDYDLVADFYRLSDGAKTPSMDEAELEDMVKQGNRVLKYLRDEKRRKHWAKFLSDWF